ncbi:MAG: IS256 family transposase [Burkholderiales bacterium]
MLKVLDGGKEGNAGEGVGVKLDEIARDGARRMIEVALQAEVEDYVTRHKEARDPTSGHALVVGNGKAESRKVTTGAGTFSIQAPRVNDKRVDENGERMRFRSKILPPYLRRSGKVTEVLPILYLRGLSTGDFKEALASLLGEDASGLSPSAVTKLTASWRGEYDTWRKRPIKDEYLYIWADGVYFNIRLEEDRLAALVVIGVRVDGTKQLLAIEDGYRESTESWLSVLRDLKARGMKAPLVAVGDRALGFWAACDQMWPETRQANCWVHRIANVLDKLPRRLQPKAKRALHDMMYADSRASCEAEIAKFTEEYQAKYPKAVESLTTDVEKLMVHFDFPAEHWKHLRTTNPIESTFATVKLRTRTTKGAGSRSAGLTMAFKLIQLAEKHWRKLDAHHLLQQLRDGVRFKDGKQIETETKTINNQEAAKVAA